MSALVPGGETVLDVEGRAVAASAEAEADAGAVRVRAVLRYPRVPSGAAALVASALEAATLGLAGDAVLEAEGGCLAARRRLVDPAPGAVDDAAWGLARAIAGTAVLVESAAAVLTTTAALRSMPELPPGFEPTVPRRVPGFARAAEAAPPRATPDPSWSPVGHLEQGRCYLVLERRDGWVNVDDERGRSVWADGRLLLEGTD